MTDDAELSHRQVRKLAKRFRVVTGKGFKLDDWRTDDPMSKLADTADAGSLLQRGVKRLAQHQEHLYADGRRSLLLVFQAMDAGGKDGTIKHVMSGVNPQGVTVTSFKRPGPDELAHDFLWRVHRAVPPRGMIGIFNRSHYEDVLITRVHPDLLESQHLPLGASARKDFWTDRLYDIEAFERYLARQGVTILKFFLHISLEEQKRRFLARLEDREKIWKFSVADMAEREHWPAYMKAYGAAIAGTATAHAPWFVIPADQKWFARLAVVSTVNAALEDLDLAPPVLSSDEEAKLADVRKVLETESKIRQP